MVSICSKYAGIDTTNWNQMELQSLSGMSDLASVCYSDDRNNFHAVDEFMYIGVDIRQRNITCISASVFTFCAA